MASFETIIYEKKEGIGYVTLNRPKSLNVYNIQMRDDMYAVLGAIKDDSDIQVVIFNGAGEKAFCAGADLSEFLTAPSPVIARRVRWERDVWGRFLNLPQPLIAAVHGFVLGSGIEMALCCDIRIASNDTKFGVPETTLGIIPAAGGTQTLPRVVGRAKALESLLTGDLIVAEDALRMGLINRMVPREQLLPCAEEMAKSIKARSPQAVKLAKQAIHRGLDMSLAEGFEMERRLCYQPSC